MGTGVEEVAAAEAVKGGAEAAGLGEWGAATAGMGEGMGSAAAASDFATATAGMGAGMGDAAAWEAATSGMAEGMGSAAAGASTLAPALTETGASTLAPTATATQSALSEAATGIAEGTGGSSGALSGPAWEQAGTLSNAWDTAQPYLKTAMSAANKALPYASLANSVMAQNRAGDRLASVNQNAGRTGEVANQLLSQYQTGQLSGADQQGIVQYKQQQLAAIDQYYQKAGLSNSSMHVQARAQAESQAETMRQQALDNTLKSGLSASQITNQTALQAAQQGFNQDKQAGDTLAEFMKVLGQMNTPQKTKTPTGTPGA